MRKTVFSTIISTRAQERLKQPKKDGVDNGAASNASSATENALEQREAVEEGNLSSQKKNAPQAQQEASSAIQADDKSVPEIYDDATVCQILHIRRSVVASVRNRNNRGRDWDVIGLHVGMTRDWIVKYGCLHGHIPNFDGATPIASGDGIVSVVLVQTFPNPSMATVEIVATGDREIATVRNMMHYPMRLRQAFDCVRSMHNRLEWSPKLNNVAW